MFEKIVKSAFEIVSKDKKNTKIFYVLTHKKHRREIYFEGGSVQAISFMKFKFSGFWKNVFYILLKLGVIQPFLKKIILPASVGQLVFVAGQIKIFDFERKEVISFPMANEIKKKKFIEIKTFQKKVGAMGFAPRVYQIEENLVFSREELVSPLKDKNAGKIFERLRDYYNLFGRVGKIDSKDFIINLKERLIVAGIKDNFIFSTLNFLNKKSIELKTLTIHGDFALGQILEKNGRILFADFEPSTNLITEDLSNFFRFSRTLLQNKEVRAVLKFYPETVRKNAAYYLILNEIYNLSLKPAYLNRAKIKIKELMKHLFRDY